MLYAAFRRYLQGIGHVRPVMFVLVSANLINWLFNWLLIYGHWGFPKLGRGGIGVVYLFGSRLHGVGVAVFHLVV